MKGRDITWTLAMIKNFQTTNSGYKRFVFSRKTKGLFVATLGVESGFAMHCVATDCNKRLIYDCVENHVLQLNRKNLDFCEGSFHNIVKCIPHCFKIQQNPPPKKRKHTEI